MERNPRPTFRLNDVETLFYDELELRQKSSPQLKPSSLLRWCVRSALTDQQSKITPEQSQALLAELSLLRKELRGIGGNLNQIAHYFNTHNYLIESDLSHQHKDMQIAFKRLTKVLSEVSNGIVRTTY